MNIPAVQTLISAPTVPVLNSANGTAAPVLQASSTGRPDFAALFSEFKDKPLETGPKVPQDGGVKEISAETGQSADQAEDSAATADNPMQKLPKTVDAFAEFGENIPFEIPPGKITHQEGQSEMGIGVQIPPKNLPVRDGVSARSNAPHAQDTYQVADQRSSGASDRAEHEENFFIAPLAKRSDTKAGIVQKSADTKLQASDVSTAFFSNRTQVHSLVTEDRQAHRILDLEEKAVQSGPELALRKSAKQFFSDDQTFGQTSEKGVLHQISAPLAKQGTTEAAPSVRPDRGSLEASALLPASPLAPNSSVASSQANRANSLAVRTGHAPAQSAAALPLDPHTPAQPLATAPTLSQAYTAPQISASQQAPTPTEVSQIPNPQVVARSPAPATQQTTAALLTTSPASASAAATAAPEPHSVPTLVHSAPTSADRSLAASLIPSQQAGAPYTRLGDYRTHTSSDASPTTVTMSFSKMSPLVQKYSGPPASGMFVPKISSAIGQSALQDQSISLLSVSDTSEMLNWDPARSVSPLHTTTQPLRGDLAPHVARQLVEVMAQAAHRPIEIALSPQELGRVRMSIKADDGTITVSILAERPETLDLMRRNVDQLGQTFRQMGYESITFAFSTGTGDSPQGDQGSDDAPASSGTAATPSQTGEASTLHSTTLHLDDASTTGVDIRL